MELKYLSWEEIRCACKCISSSVLNSDFKPDLLILLSRGGLIPGRLISDYLNIKKIVVIDTKFYNDNKEPNKILYIDDYDICKLKQFHNKKALLIDDIYDTGTTISQVKKVIKENSDIELKTAVISLKKKAGYEFFNVVDYFYFLSEEGEWVVYPWEEHENQGYK